jgi:hypothetical protein
MRRATFFFLAFIPVLISMTGCVFVLGGAAGALGAYGLSRDTIQGDSDVPYDALWSAAEIVCKARGTMKKNEELQGVIEYVERDSTRVWVRLICITDATTRLRISARKFHFPNISLAQDLYVRIIEQTK